MDQLIEEIRAAARGKAWVLALFGLLAIPDICAALSSSDGRTSGARYKAWFDANLRYLYPEVDADEFYQIRCSTLHQASSSMVKQGVQRTCSRVLFVAPQPGTVVHRNIINDGLNLDLNVFSKDVLAAAEAWLAAYRHTEPVKSNLQNVLRWHPDGFPPYLGGIPVLT